MTDFYTFTDSKPAFDFAFALCAALLCFAAALPCVRASFASFMSLGAVVFRSLICVGMREGFSCAGVSHEAASIGIGSSNAFKVVSSTKSIYRTDGQSIQDLLADGLDNLTSTASTATRRTASASDRASSAPLGSGTSLTG